MKELIPVPKMSEVLRTEFMEPLGLSAYRVAKDIMVPVSRIQESYKTNVKSLQIQTYDCVNILECLRGFS